MFKITHSLPAALLLALTFTPFSTVWACSGTPLPPTCPQSAYVAKYPLATGVNPGAGDVTVPIALAPGAFWDNLTMTCADPASATLTLNLSCSPVMPGPPLTLGAAVAVGPLDVPVDTPTLPGVQNLPGGFAVTIPEGTLPAGPFVCDVVGTYAVTFGSGIGSGVVSGGGDTQVCFVDPAPDGLANDIPRLDLQLLLPEGDDIIRSHQGDQDRLFYGVMNNDPNESVDVEFGVTTNQVARLPEGNNNDNTFFAFSDPNPGTDNFPVAFGDLLGNDVLIPLPDPTEVSDRLITREFTLPPNGIAIVPVEIRSHGMCADGSCNEIKVFANGNYADSSAERACGGSALLVDNSQPLQTPQCTIEDWIQTAPNVDSQWGPGHFGGDHLSTFSTGHLNPFASQPGEPLRDAQTNEPIFQTTGGPLAQQFNQPFPSMLHNSLTTDSFGGTMQFNMIGFPEQQNFQQQRMQVTVDGIPPDNGVIIPLFGKENSNSDLRVNLSSGNDSLLIVDNANNQELFNGPAAEFQSNPPNGLFIDTETFRMVTKADQTDRNTMTTSPLGVAELYTTNQAPPIPIEVLNAQTKQPIEWQAAITQGGNVVSLSADNGPAGTPIMLNVDLANVAQSPNTTIATLNVTNDSMLNSPLEVPIALRRLAELQSIAPLQFSNSTYQVDEFGNIGTLEIQVNRLDSSDGAVSVDYASRVSNGAESGVDFNPISGTLNWADGDMTPQSIMVSIIDDNIPEPDETFTLSLSNPTGQASLGPLSEATVTIIDNDETIDSVGIGPDGSLINNNSSFGGGIESASGGQGTSLTVAQTDPVTVRGRFLIDPNDVGKTADIIILALYTLPDGQSFPFMRDGLFWALWDGELASLTAAETRQLDSFFDIFILESIPLIGLAGRFDFFLAYNSPETGLIFNGAGLLSLTVE